MSERPRRRGVTFVELVLLLALLLAAATIAAYGARLYGWTGLLVGLPLGFIAAFLTFSVVGFGCVILLGLVCLGIPELPVCRNGLCRATWTGDLKDYTQEQIDGRWNYYRCRCGHLYQKLRSERRVGQVESDGTVTPYMVWKPFRGWFLESRESPARIHAE